MYRYLKELKKIITNVKKIMKTTEKNKAEEKEKLKNLEKKVKQPRKKRKLDVEPAPPPPVETTNSTLKIMVKISKYHGLAIRRNSESVENIEIEIRAIFLPLYLTDAKP